MMLDKQRLRTFILGGLTGVLAGILLAPKSGKETRGDIADAVGETREKNRERYFDTQESVRERFSANRDGATRRFHEPRVHEPNVGEPREETAAPRYEAPEAGSGGEVRTRPFLRDVSREFPDETSSEEPLSRSEELRRKVRETRERIRSGTPSEETREDEE